MKKKKIKQRILEYISGTLGTLGVGLILIDPQIIGSVIGGGIAPASQNSAIGILLIIFAGVIYAISENGKK